MTLTLIQGWHTHQLDFVPAYPQAESEGKICMKFLQRIQIARKMQSQNTCTEALENIYGLKQAGRVWNI